jgi:hypothetical protein
MTPVKAVPLVRFALHFADGKKAELCMTEFRHPSYAPNGRRAVRGKYEGAHDADDSFQWSPAVKVLVCYLLVPAGAAPSPWSLRGDAPAA